MIDGVKRCPQCVSNLSPVRKGGLVTYECPNGHGVGINILEEYRNLQGDELDAIMKAVDGAPLSKLLSPITGKPMSTVTFMADDDMVEGNSGPGAVQLTIEVDVENYFGWFSFEELRDMPLSEATSSPGAGGFVGLDALSRGDSRNAGVFANLEPEDYEDDDWRDTAGDSLAGFLGGVARRIR
jgi:hypothetical protein